MYLVDQDREIGVSKPQIHILFCEKKTLEIHKRIVIDCDRLTPETADDISFKVHGTGLLIGSSYRSKCRVGNLSFGNSLTQSGHHSLS